MATYVYRTPDSTFTGEKYTFSGWFKRGDLSARNCMLWASSDGGSANYAEFEFKADGTLHWGHKPQSGTAGKLVTYRVFSDPAAWYHLVFTYDTTLDASDRMKIYVNGVQETSFSGQWNAGDGETGTPLATDSVEVDIGKQTGSTNYYYGEMSHLNLCIGYAYAASDFGETDSTSGIWKPIASPSVTHGTNGWQLKMEDRTNLDLDTSSNAYTFTTSGNLTATYDNPSNNFCTGNPLDNYFQDSTFSNGNNAILTPSSAVYTFNTGTQGLSAGLWYFESKIIDSANQNCSIGISDVVSDAASNYLGEDAGAWSYYGDGRYTNNSTYYSYGDSYDDGDIIGCFIDLTANKLYFSKNGTIQNSGTGISITAPASTTNGFYLIAVGDTYANTTLGVADHDLNFGNGYFGTDLITSPSADEGGIGAFKYDPSDGGASSFDGAAKNFRAICTKNIKAYGG